MALSIGLASTAKTLTDYRSILLCTCVLAVLAGIAFVAYSSRIKRRLCWKVNYKGHAIVFDGGRAFAERLYLDDGLVRQGGFGVKMEIRTTIKAGDGIGDEIVVWYDARILSCRCRIEVEEKSWGTQTGENERMDPVSLAQSPSDGPTDVPQRLAVGGTYQRQTEEGQNSIAPSEPRFSRDSPYGGMVNER